MDDFQSRYSAWRERAAPKGSEDDALSELHADLMLVDSWLAETIIPVATRRRYVEPKVDISAALKDIVARAEAFKASMSGTQRDEAMSYLSYGEDLERLHAAFCDALERGGFDRPS